MFSMAKSFCTQNGIFFVDCHKVQEVLLPQLNTIFKEMMQLIITDVFTFSDEVIKDVDKLSEVCVLIKLCRFIMLLLIFSSKFTLL